MKFLTAPSPENVIATLSIDLMFLILNLLSKSLKFAQGMKKAKTELISRICPSSLYLQNKDHESGSSDCLCPEFTLANHKLIFIWCIGHMIINISHCISMKWQYRQVKPQSTYKYYIILHFHIEKRT